MTSRPILPESERTRRTGARSPYGLSRAGFINGLWLKSRTYASRGSLGLTVRMDLSDRQWELIKHFSPSKKHATKEIFLYMELINTVFQRCPRLVVDSRSGRERELPQQAKIESGGRTGQQVMKGQMELDDLRREYKSRHLVGSRCSRRRWEVKRTPEAARRTIEHEQNTFRIPGRRCLSLHSSSQRRRSRRA